MPGVSTATDILRYRSPQPRIAPCFVGVAGIPVVHSKGPSNVIKRWATSEELAVFSWGALTLPSLVTGIRRPQPNRAVRFSGRQPLRPAC
jgi:hypothetical protein